MIKLKDLAGKAKQLFKKLGTKTIISACAILVIGCAVLLTFLLDSPENDNYAQKNNLAVDVTSDADKSTLKADDVLDYFASIALQRNQARDEAIEVLKTVTTSETALEEAKQSALDDINKMARDIEREANIETLILSKGFTQCIAVISDDKCNIIVETSGLLPGEVAQISEIVYEQTGIVPENLKIIEKNT